MNGTGSDIPQWLRRGQIPSLDGLRAIAVLLVLLAHTHQTQGFPDIRPLHALGSRAGIGVDVFFVISGFLITVLMLRERDRTGRLDVRGFYLRRLLRIVPAYTCLLGVVGVLCAFGLAQLTTRDWITAVTYTVNFVRHPAWEIGHAWSLSIEEHFYLGWPVLMATAAGFGRRVALGCLVFCFVARWVVLLAFPTYTPMAELWTFTRLDAIATGCLLAFLARDYVWRARLDSACGRNWFVLLVAACLAGSLALSSSDKFSLGMGYSLNAACIALLLWAAVRRPEGALGRILNHKITRSVGVMSYSLYLWQQLFLHPGVSGFIHAFPQNIFFAFLTAAASYWLIEKPFLGLKPVGTTGHAGQPSEPSARAVVMTDVTRDAVVAGNPARVVKHLVVTCSGDSRRARTDDTEKRTEF